jgi:hypothetical protein
MVLEHSMQRPDWQVAAVADSPKALAEDAHCSLLVHCTVHAPLWHTPTAQSAVEVQGVVELTSASGLTRQRIALHSTASGLAKGPSTPAVASLTQCRLAVHCSLTKDSSSSSNSEA